MIAAFKIRAVPININFRYVEDELAYLFDNADLVALVHDREYVARVAAVAAEDPGPAPLRRHAGRRRRVDADADDPRSALGPLGSVPFAEAVAAGSPERDFGERSGDDHYVLYTGGTTGMPKGVVWRHEDVFFALGGGIDAYTDERVTSDHAAGREGRRHRDPDGHAVGPAADARRRPVGRRCGSGSRAARSCSCPASRPRRCGRRSSARRSTR